MSQRPDARLRSRLVILGEALGTVDGASMSGGGEQADILTVGVLVKERWKVVSAAPFFSSPLHGSVSLCPSSRRALSPGFFLA